MPATTSLWLSPLATQLASLSFILSLSPHRLSHSPPPPRSTDSSYQMVARVVSLDPEGTDHPRLSSVVVRWGSDGACSRVVRLQICGGRSLSSSQFWRPTWVPIHSSRPPHCNIPSIRDKSAWIVGTLFCVK